MQIKFFTLPIIDNSIEQDEMNRFLRSQKILSVENHLSSNEHGTWWCFCVKYVDQPQAKSQELYPNKRKDYKNELDEASFALFAKLREIRKKIAVDDAVPAYAVCTDEELAAIAQLPELSRQTLLTIKGFGEKKAEKYAERIIALLKQTNEHETSGLSI